MDMPCSSAGRGCRAVMIAPPGSLCLDAGNPGDPFRSFDLVAHEACELRRRHNHRLGTQALEALAYLRCGDDLRDVVRDLLHDRRRRAAGRPEAVPEGEFVAGHAWS